MAGEPLAVDLADTIITSRDPVVDLLADEAACRFWWGLQQDRLPDGTPAPSLALTIELRQAVREILDAHIAGISPSAAVVNRVNDIASSVACTRQLVQTPAGWAALTTRHPPADRLYELALAAVAESLIDLLVGPAHNRLRRCENPTCSMLFVASDPAASSAPRTSAPTGHEWPGTTTATAPTDLGTGQPRRCLPRRQSPAAV